MRRPAGPCSAASASAAARIACRARSLRGRPARRIGSAVTPFATFAERALVRRNGRPEDVAQAIAALAGNGFLTGVVLPCDGGLRLT
jgi:NAD(P)-dependent dehydrogenase (short-subunit alcohol dehydrogenase family)